MTVRTKASLVAFAVTAIWIVLFLIFVPIGKSLIWGVGFLAAFLIGTNLSVALAMRLFHCPHCGARLGWHTFTRHGWSQPWAYRDCWICGGDLSAKSN